MRMDMNLLGVSENQESQDRRLTFGRQQQYQSAEGHFNTMAEEEKVVGGHNTGNFNPAVNPMQHLLMLDQNTLESVEFGLSRLSRVI